jgi:hypothetical protein
MMEVGKVGIAATIAATIVGVVVLVAVWRVLTGSSAPLPSAAATVSPGSVRTHEVPGPATLTLAAPPDKGKELTGAVQILIGAEKISPASREASSVTFVPPRRETAGEVEVRVLNAQDEVLALGRIHYEDRASPVTRTLLAIFYTIMILGFPFVLMRYDLQKAYAFAGETRMLIIRHAASNGLTSEELKLLLNELNQSPPGVPGLARNSIAFMLMMILGVAIVHILAVDPPGAKDIPASIDRILVLLTGLLTSVVSFYFGSKAAEAAQQTVGPGRVSSETTPQPQIATVTPDTGTPGTSVKISGVGFGAEKGVVTFGEAVADIQTWADREVTVAVPAAAKPGNVPVTVMPKGTERKVVSPTEFRVVSGAGGQESADAERDLDGCDVPVTSATADEDLPAAEGGVQR